MRAVCSSDFHNFKRCKELKSRKVLPDRLEWWEHGFLWNLVERERMVRVDFTVFKYHK